MNSFHHTAVNFIGQNYGARKPKNIKKVLIYTLLLVFGIGEFLGISFYLLGPWLLKAYTNEAEVVGYALVRLSYVCALYALCGIMDVLVGALRGIGYSFIPMITSLLGVCVFRVVWVYTVFAKENSLNSLYISYPISWIVTAALLALCFVILYPSVKKKLEYDLGDLMENEENKKKEHF